MLKGVKMFENKIPYKKQAKKIYQLYYGGYGT